MNKKGFTLLEVLITAAIFSLILFSLFEIFRMALHFWESAGIEIFQFKKINKSIPILEERLKAVQRITQVSLSNNKGGYIQFIDIDNNIVSIYQNNAINQELFQSNHLPTNNIVVCMSDHVTTSSATVLLSKIEEFGIETFGEERTFFRIATKNNMVAPVPLDQISTIRFRILGKDKNSLKERFQLVHLFKFSRVSPGTITYDFSDATGFVLSNAELKYDPLTNSYGAVIPTPSYKVKIANTGQYFDSIQAAVNAAVSGNEIWVAAGVYEECVSLKNGVKLYGGFEPLNWSRDIAANPTTIKTKIGISDRAIDLADNGVVDGFTIDGQNLTYGIYGSSVENFIVSNCKIYATYNSIYLDNAFGKIYNNEVTGNSSTLIWQNSSGGSQQIYRNRFFSNNNFGKSNIQFVLVKTIEFRNNVVIKGSKGIDVDRSSINIVNNLIEKIENIAMSGNLGSVIFFANNIVVNNNIGVFSPNSVITIVFNFFCDNRFGNTAVNYPTLGVGNIQKSGSFNWDSAEPFTRNPIFDVLTFELLDSADICIDKGHDASEFNDIFPPGKGLITNDIGVFGGPWAGRLGPGQIVNIQPTDTNVQSKISHALPGDFIVFKEGTFNLDAINLRPGLNIYGKTPELTRIYCNGTYGFNLENQVNLQNLSLIGNQSNIGMQATGKQGIYLKNVLLTGFHEAVNASASNLTISNITCTENQIAMNADNGATLAISNSILASNTYGIQSLNASLVNTHSVLFLNNIADTNGLVTQTKSIAGTLPLFWDSSDFNYSLHPSSNAINAGSVAGIDLGCFEFYYNEGKIDFPLIASHNTYVFSTITATISGDPDTVPVIPVRTSQLELAYLLNGSVPTTINPVITVTNNNKIEYTWNLGQRVIGQRFLLRAVLKSFRFQRTIFLKALSLSWR